MSNAMILGSHMDMKAPNYLFGAVQQTIENGANALMIYSGAPQNTYRKDIHLFRIDEGLALMKEYGIAEDKIIVHAPYIINLANTTKPETFEIAVIALTRELERCQAMHATTLVLHPGSHVGAGVDAGIEKIIEGLNLVIPAMGNVDIALESMSGKGSEIGFSFDQLAAIVHGVDDPSKFRICLDTCHLHDAGYDIGNFNQVLDEFSRHLPLEMIKVVHVNDSKNIRGAKKDRHENFGFGEIGFDALLSVIEHPALANIPKILETPYIEKEFAPYQREIAMIRSKQFNPHLFDDYKNC